METTKNYELLSTESSFQDLFTSLFSKNKLYCPLLIVDTRNSPQEKAIEYKKTVPNSKVALITALPFTPEKLKPLWEEIDFVLPEDLQPVEALGFINALQTPSASQMPLISIARFRTHLYESLQTFFALNPLTETQNLRNAVHKIAGSSATYGYPTFGRLAKELDTLLTASSLPANFPSIYTIFLRKALFAFQKIEV